MAKQGERSLTALGALADAASTQCKAGEVAAGVDAARSAFQGASSVFGPDHGFTRMASIDLGFCLILAGRFDAASSLLDKVDMRGLSELTMNPNLPEEIQVMRAAIMAGTGDAAGGAALARQQQRRFEGPQGDAYMRRWISQLNP